MIHHNLSTTKSKEVTQNSNDLLLTFPQLFAVAATLKSIDYNVAMTFILNNNNNS